MLSRKHRSYLTRLFSVLGMLILPLLLASCAPGHETKPSNGCEWVKPIYPSVNDRLTDSTAKQILDHDETGKTICGWKQP